MRVLATNHKQQQYASPHCNFHVLGVCNNLCGKQSYLNHITLVTFIWFRYFYDNVIKFSLCSKNAILFIWFCIKRSKMCMRGVQKVHRPTQSSTRYVHHSLSLFNIVSCKWNASGPMFVQSLDFIVEESLILLFQPTICRVDNVPPPQSCPYARGFWIPSDARCLGSTQVHTPNGILIGSTTFAGLKIVTNRPTDRPRYCICNNRPHLHSSGMQPNNKLCNIVVTDGTNQWHISMKFIMSIYISLQSFWMPLINKIK